MPCLYALIVSVSKYPIAGHSLPGCANDFETMKALLEQQALVNGLNYCPMTLNDELATRQGIIDGFDHFKAAGPDDYCVFYFSGHGSYVPVDNVFYNNSSGRNESLVCYDSRLRGGRDLMDKELAYLAHRSMHEGQPKFVSILDCCHSGSAFRSSLEEGTAEAGAKTRQTPANGFVAAKDYLGFDSYFDIDGKKQPPIYPGLHLAACQPHELAQERTINGVPQGVFTYCLSRELSLTDPTTSAEELMRRVNFRANTVNPKQFPYLEKDKGVEAGRALFTETGDSTQSFYTHRFQIGFRDGNWYVNAGAQQGIQPGIPGHQTSFKEDDGTIWTVCGVQAHRSEVNTNDKTADKSELYTVQLKENGRAQFKVALHPELPTAWKETLVAVANSQFPAIELLSEATESTAYRIDQLVDNLILVRTGEEYPLFERVEMFGGEFGMESAATFLDRVQYVAAWEAVLALNNPHSRIKDRDISVEVVVDDGNKENLVVTDFDEAVPLRYHSKDGEEIEPLYQIKITNNSQRTYWISALQASSDFGISNGILPMKEFAPGQSYFLGDEEIEGEDSSWQAAFIDDKYKSWSVNEITDYLRIVISLNHQVNTNGFNQDALPLDEKSPYRGEEKNKGSRPAKPRQKADDWTVKGLALRIIRPLESTVINEESDKELEGLQIEAAPTGFSANAKLGTLKTGNRSLKHPLPPAFAQGELLSFNSLSGTRNLSEALNVLELTDVKNADAISADHPLKIQRKKRLAANETVIPFAYDPVSEAYYPLGHLDEDGNILIQDLPEEVAEDRSLGGSIKIFFQKIVGTKLGVELDYPLLRRVKENEAGVLVYADEDIEQIKAVIEKPEVKQVAVFIHGIIGDTTTSTALLQHVARERNESFTDQYQVTLTFDYENLNTNIDKTAKELLKKLQAVGLGNNGKKLHLFAHSMGGLVSRWMIEKEEGYKLVDQLFTFGTPHGGSPWSNVAEMATTAITYAINGITVSNFWMMPLLGVQKLWKATQTTLGEMKPDGSFIKRLNDGATAPIPYTLITGNTQLIKSDDPEKSKKFLQRLLYRFRYQPHYALLDLALFKSPNDIAVTVESQQMVKGDLVNKPAPIPCDHLSYFSNPDCVKLVAGLLDDGTSPSPKEI